MMIKIADTKTLTHEEWLAKRREGIGGSDAPIIVGKHRFGSELELWADKMGYLPPKEDTEVMRQGRDLEEYVARRWTEATGKKVRRSHYIWQNTAYPFARANVDREVVGENAGLECKTTSLYNKSDFESGQIPDAYYVQCVHYMAVMGYERMYLAVLVLSGGFYHFCIERDEGEISALMEQEEFWWMSRINCKEAPPPDGSESAAAVLKQLHPQDTGETRPLWGMEEQLRRLDELNGWIDEFETERETIRQGIQQALGDATYGESETHQVSWKTQESRRLDGRALKKDHPQLYAEYTRPTAMRVLRIKVKIKESV